MQVLGLPQTFLVAGRGPGICIWNRGNWDAAGRNAEQGDTIHGTKSQGFGPAALMNHTVCAQPASPGPLHSLVLARDSFQPEAFSGDREDSSAQKREAWKCGDFTCPGNLH